MDITELARLLSKESDYWVDVSPSEIRITVRRTIEGLKCQVGLSIAGPAASIRGEWEDVLCKLVKLTIDFPVHH